MLISYDENEQGLVCRLVGDLEDVAASQFREVDVRSNGKERVIFELSGVRFVSSAGLGALIRAMRRIRETGAAAVVCAAKPRVKRWLQIVGLPREASLFDSLSTARAYLELNACA
jgi:anti-anti-sigma factor